MSGSSGDRARSARGAPPRGTGGSETASGRDRSRRFARLLGEPAGSPESQLMAVPPFMRREAPPVPLPALRPGAASCAVAAAEAAGRVVDRVLVGSGPAGAEARLRFSSGVLGGTEIALRSVGGAIEFQILGTSEPARRSLLDAVEQVATKLRARGTVLRENAATGGRHGSGGGDRRERGR